MIASHKTDTQYTRASIEGNAFHRTTQQRALVVGDTIANRVDVPLSLCQGQFAVWVL